MRVSIVIPALNEEESIGRVLDQIPFDRLPETEVIVVDNGSHDGTAKVAVNKGARVIFEPHKGYGVATRKGLSEAKGDIVVTMDADGGHWPGDLPKMVRPVDVGSHLAALGVRIHSYPHGMRIRRFLGNVLLARFFNTLYKERLSDVQCGFRAIHRNALSMLKLTEDGMQFTTELLIELKEKGISILPVQVEQMATKRSHLKEVQDFAKHVTLMLRRFPGVRSVRNLEAP
ncbi:MAG TPA: glycosyltransferase family 2 protein [Candidatus Bathyarchaeia archaeon]|nr:glycosyltransferase family 2 protein [Candidatus Bathyarchaeia archaeon]